MDRYKIYTDRYGECVGKQCSNGSWVMAKDVEFLLSTIDKLQTEMNEMRYEVMALKNINDALEKHIQESENTNA